MPRLQRGLLQREPHVQIMTGWTARTEVNNILDFQLTVFQVDRGFYGLKTHPFIVLCVRVL